MIDALDALAGLAAVAALASPASADVLVVDPSGGGDFTTLAAAVAAADDGDVVLVRTGVYGPTAPNGELSIEDRTLAIVADQGANVDVRDRLRVRFQDAGDAVLLQGLRFTGSSPASTVTVRAGTGPTWIQDCVLGAPKPGGVGTHGLALEHSGRVTVIGSTVDGPPLHYGLGAAVMALATDLYLYDSTLATGMVQPALDLPADGADALRLEQGTAYASRCGFFGGDGSPGVDDPVLGCLPGGEGGAGVQLGPSALPTELRWVASGFAGGAGGAGVAPCHVAGPPGLGIDAQSGTVTAISGNGRTLRLDSPVREGGVTQLQLGGEPGEQVYMLVSDAQGPAYLPAHRAALLVAQPLPFVAVGQIPATGTLVLDVTLPDVGLGPDDALVLYVQAAFQGPSGVTTSGGGALVVLDGGA